MDDTHFIIWVVFKVSTGYHGLSKAALRRTVVLVVLSLLKKKRAGSCVVRLTVCTALIQIKSNYPRASASIYNCPQSEISIFLDVAPFCEPYSSICLTTSIPADRMPPSSTRANRASV